MRSSSKFQPDEHSATLPVHDPVTVKMKVRSCLDVLVTCWHSEVINMCEVLQYGEIL